MLKKNCMIVPSKRPQLQVIQPHPMRPMHWDSPTAWTLSISIIPGFPGPMGCSKNLVRTLWINCLPVINCSWMWCYHSTKPSSSSRRTWGIYGSFYQSLGICGETGSKPRNPIQMLQELMRTTSKLEELREDQWQVCWLEACTTPSLQL
jgi:hypothetical protein